MNNETIRALYENNKSLQKFVERIPENKFANAFSFALQYC